VRGNDNLSNHHQNLQVEREEEVVVDCEFHEKKKKNKQKEIFIILM